MEEKKQRQDDGFKLTKKGCQKAPWSYLLACLAVVATTFCIQAMHHEISNISIPMLYLLVITVSSLLFGRLPAVVASGAAFLLFDWYFVEPIHNFTVSDPEEWLALVVFLLTSVVISQLMAMLRMQAQEARLRRSETQALAEASWAIASEPNRDIALSKVLKELADILDPAAIVLFVPRTDSGYKIIAHYPSGPNLDAETGEFGVAHQILDVVIRDKRKVELPAQTNPETKYEDDTLPPSLYLPVLLEAEALGVIYCKLRDDRKLAPIAQHVIQLLINHAAVIIQRDRLMNSETNAHALAETTRLQTTLLSMISHDFRSPLTSIKANVGNLLESNASTNDATRKILLDSIEGEVDRLNKMVGNVLDYSRLEAGAWRPKRESCDLTELVSSTLDSFSKKEGERIEIDLDFSRTEIFVDSVQFVQVLRNLLENALKYSSEEQKINLRSLASNGSLLIEVLDRGTGLPEGEESRVFEPFYRASKLRESNKPGVGIGLAICRGLTEANGGNLSAENRDGGGTIFRVTLPLQPPLRTNVPSVTNLG